MLVNFIFTLIMINMLMMSKSFILTINMFKNLNLNLEFDFNFINQVFSVTVFMISMKVLMYSKDYFHFNLSKLFKMNLFIFVASMIILINSNSMMSIIIGWDGLGISSFYLVSYYSNYESFNSSLITFFFNRLGDSMMMIFFSIILINYSSIMMIKMNDYLLFIMFMGLITKSCQIPFGMWLPMAMSAPTPISSLVHSSTLVTAGIFMIMKMNFLFLSSAGIFFFFFFSLLTFSLSGLFAFFVMDMKKAIAFSTFSQLGFIMFSISIGNFMISFIHLVLHAFFKSSLFINMGLFMKFNNSIQDPRNMDNYSKNMMFKLTFIFSCLNLMGMVSFSGFLSKDFILIFNMNNVSKFMTLSIVYLGCMLTACYSIKFSIFMFSNNLKSMKINFNKVLNVYYLGILLSFIILMTIPVIFMDFLVITPNFFLSSEFKLTLYLIIMMSMILVKILFYVKNIFMVFSSMGMMMEIMMKIMNKIIKLMLKFNSFFIMMDENKINLVLKIFSYSSNKFMMKYIFLMNFNLLVLLMNIW